MKLSSTTRVVIVGAGFGGIAAAIELRRHGFEQVTILEAAPELGGTWFHNHYPGAACDVPSHLYSFSYAQRSGWSRLCSPQAEILEYLREVAHEHGVDAWVRPDTRVVQCSFDERRACWGLQTEAGDRLEADAIVLATGQLNRPAIPRLPGIDSFRGHSFHSARWDHDYDLRGRRVAVVGTGASAVQFVPPIAPDVAQLTIFQRTGNWLLPRRNRVYARGLRRLLRRVPVIQRTRRRFLFNYAEALTLTIRFPRTLGRLGAMRSRRFMESQLPDPELRRKAWPDYTFGCKRVLFSSHYLEALGRDKVELVTDSITAVTETGLLTADGREHQVDCIIWATGFRATEFIAPMEVRGASGMTLERYWSAGAHAHLGITVPGFPSLFLMYGPNTNTSGGSIIVYLEAQAAYIRQALELVRNRGCAAVDVRAEIESAGDAETQARFKGTAWTQCDSWYRDEHGRIVTNWPGSMRDYLKRTRTLHADEYRQLG